MNQLGERRPQIRRVGAVAQQEMPCPTCGGAGHVRIAQVATPTVMTVPEAPELDPAVARIVAASTRSLVEALGGRRAWTQVMSLATRSVVAYLRSAAGIYQTRSRGALLLRCHVSQPTDQAAEVAATVALLGKPRALAARFDLAAESWRCTAVRVL